MLEGAVQHGHQRIKNEPNDDSQTEKIAIYLIILRLNGLNCSFHLVAGGRGKYRLEQDFLNVVYL